MEWFFGAFFVLMIALYVWASLPARRALSKTIQPLVDDLFDSRSEETTPTNRKDNVSG